MPKITQPSNYLTTSTGTYPVRWQGGVKDGSPCGGGTSNASLKHLPADKIQHWLFSIEKKLGPPLSIVEIGCGDLRFASYLLGNTIALFHYSGTDIEPRDSWGHLLMPTQVLDCVQGPIPYANVVFARDLFIHFDNERILKVLGHIRDSGAKYLLTTTYSLCNNDKRQHQPDEAYQPLNMEEAPFSLKLVDKWAELHENKYLGLFEI